MIEIANDVVPFQYVKERQYEGEFDDVECFNKGES